MNHKTMLQIFLCKYIKVIVILTGIDRESNGSYALLFSFTSLFTQNWMHFHCLSSVYTESPSTS